MTGRVKVHPTVVGPTVVLVFDLPQELNVEEMIKGSLPNGPTDYVKADNCAPFKHVTLGIPPQVHPEFDGSRFPQRKSHVTVIPFHEFKHLTEEQKDLLQKKEIEVSVSPNDVFWTRGSPDNAAAGCKGVFYANMVLSRETEQQILDARRDVNLPPVPPSPPQALHEADTDERLHTFRFHKSIISIFPKFLDEIDGFGLLGAEDAQKAMIEMRDRITAWANEFAIHKEGEGNVLIRVK
jgi:hypothetical protein